MIDVTLGMVTAVEVDSRSWKAGSPGGGVMLVVNLALILFRVEMPTDSEAWLWWAMSCSSDTASEVQGHHM